jgi:hypothetical protein
VQGYCLTHGGCAAQQQLWLSLHLLGSAITIIAAIIVDALTMGDNVPTFGNNQGKKRDEGQNYNFAPKALFRGF